MFLKKLLTTLTLFFSSIMDPNMKQLQETLVNIETDAEQVILARHQVSVCYWFVFYISDVMAAAH
jgi:hypothetical protein